MSWLSHVFQTWQGGLTVAGAVTATGGVLVTIRSFWRKTLGKGRYYAGLYEGMALSVRHDVIKRQFGEHDWQFKATFQQYEGVHGQTTDVDLLVRIWPLGKLGYLTTWCTLADDTVVMYGVTTRSRWFQPHVPVGPDYSIKLGRSRFAELPDPAQRPTGGRFAAVGARRFGYAEGHYFGNPGGYQTWIVGACDSGAPMSPPIGVYQAAAREWDEARYVQYRTSGVINSVIVAAGLSPLKVLDDRFLPYGVGPDQDRVRLSPATAVRPTLAARWRERQAQRAIGR
ncbi:hypothetical protein E6W39_29050 [Kitasatospora acidiphila]|uniref:Uncharacterized protein n=1 Tax=Kitasatospora acidiphila TaxID=2567942 RepID=A0A540W934_9ACTN|nr:ETEC_3214 domain-containing protein [Kitasatospora acidiphila]TQF05536.1 hypothetical protein E6W39_29050 [Kitasatospora acidiphila]